MTASLPAVFSVQEFTDTGAPASGYRLYTYTPSTTTNKTAYTDAAATTPHTYTSDGSGGSYIALNSRGELPAGLYLTSGGYDLCLKTSAGATVWTRRAYGIDDGAGAPVLASLADTTSTANGDALLGVKSTQTGGVATTQHEVNERTVHLFDFCTAAQIASIKAKDLSQDCTTALQAFFDACSSGTENTAPRGILPSQGIAKITSSLRSKSKYINISGGSGLWNFAINYNGVSGGCIVADAITYWAPTFQGFSIIGNSSSGHAIDNSAVTSDCYDGGIRDMYIEAGKAAIYFPKFCFHFDITRVRALSYTDHVFRVKMGNTSVMRGCYAVSAPSGKCGYRLAGNIALDQCNGVDSLGIWGIFGSNTAATDGWQSDFATTDYPAVRMTNCNVEAYTVAGLILHNSAKSFVWRGGKLDRHAFSTDYHSAVWATVQGQTQAPLVIDIDTFDAGTGQAKGGSFSGGTWTPGALTNAQIHASAGCWVEDTSGQLAAGLVAYSFTAGYYHDSYSHLIPFASKTATADVAGDTATVFNAVSPRRLTVQTGRYATTTLTPVGAGQTIDVTGYSKVLVTPAAAASITKATFTATQYVGSDYARNGELVIEATNGNLTVNHTARGGASDTFIMSGGANVTLAAGQIVRFLRSETGAQWQQV